MYKEAIRLGLRFPSERGPLTLEQLWTLPLPELDVLAVSLEKSYKESGKKSFLEKKNAKDKALKLQFDIVLDVLNTKVEEAEQAQNAAEIKKHNEEIFDLIAKKEKESLQGLSIEELKKRLK